MEPVTARVSAPNCDPLVEQGSTASGVRHSLDPHELRGCHRHQVLHYFSIPITFREASSNFTDSGTSSIGF